MKSFIGQCQQAVLMPVLSHSFLDSNPCSSELCGGQRRPRRARHFGMVSSPLCYTHFLFLSSNLLCKYSASVRPYPFNLPPAARAQWFLHHSLHKQRRRRVKLFRKRGGYCHVAINNALLCLEAWMCVFVCICVYIYISVCVCVRVCVCNAILNLG